MPTQLPQTRTACWPDPADVPAVEMPSDSAVALGRHAKAALMHVRQVERFLDAAGVNLDAPYNSIGDLLRAAGKLAQDLDLWATNNVYRNGADRRAYSGTERWCHAPGGTLPT